MEVKYTQLSPGPKDYLPFEFIDRFSGIKSESQPVECSFVYVPSDLEKMVAKFFIEMIIPDYEHEA